MALSDKANAGAVIELISGGPTIFDAEAAAEAELRKAYDALRERYDPVPVLRWDGDEATLLDCWRLSIGERSEGLYWWSTMLGDAEGLGSFGVDGDDCASADEARRAAEAALRALGVAFRVEGA
jgi:hypothetical protein